MDAKDKRIAELEAELAIYRGSPSAEFYTALVEGVAYITEEIRKKRLNLGEDSFADSILKLAEKSDKIFAGLDKGIASFSQQDVADNDVRKKKIKDITSAAI